MTTRNPSPPPDLSDELQHVDNIGDSAYSKRWLFSLLMQLLNYAKSVNDTLDIESGISELDPDLEAQLCCLWDLTVNCDILPHLDEFNLIQILTDILLCQQYPRLQVYVDYILDSLLIATVRLVDAITRADDSLAEIWCVPELLEAVLTAQHQMKCMHGDEIEIVHRLFYTFSSNANGVAALNNLYHFHFAVANNLLANITPCFLVKLFAELLPTLGVYLRKVCEDEPHLIPFLTYHNSLRAIVPVLDCVIASVPAHDSVTCFKTDQTILPCLLHIAMGCQKQVDNVPMIKGILTDLRILFKDLALILHSYFQHLSPSRPSVTAAASEVLDSFRWLTDLESDRLDQVNEEKDLLYPNISQIKAAELRESFVRCCLEDGDEGTRGKLISICHYLKLPKLLETITDD